MFKYSSQGLQFFDDAGKRLWPMDLNASHFVCRVGGTAGSKWSWCMPHCLDKKVAIIHCSGLFVILHLTVTLIEDFDVKNSLVQ